MEYYERLGVSSDAPSEEIERAYRQKLKETHPDVSDDEDASERTKELIEAKEVLTDEKKRRRYDRLGHDDYLTVDEQTVEPATRRGTAQTAATREETAADNGSSQRTRTTDFGGYAGKSPTESGQQTRSRHVGGRSRQWSSVARCTASAGADQTWQAQSTEGSFAVRRGEEPTRRGRVFSSERSLVLFGTTFVVYPVFLFGALYPEFPLFLNLVVAICVVLTIAVLQSIPEVGIAVFGIWSVLLPPILFGGIGIRPLSPAGIFATTAVVFPLCLSTLTWYVLRPLKT